MNNNKNNRNPFAQMQNGKSPFGNMPMPQRTTPMIKWLVIGIFGILPFLLLIFLVGPDATVSGDWRFSVDDPVIFPIPYGMMWVLSIVTIIVCSILVSLVVRFTPDVNMDVIPQTVGFLFMGMGFYVIPLVGWYSLFFLFIAPVLYILGLIIGGLGILIVTFRKLAKAQKDPEVQKQMEEFQRQMQQQMGQQPQGPQGPKQPNQPKDEEANYQDNPFVDLEPEEDEEEK